MQIFSDIEETRTLTESRMMLLNNDMTVLSNNAGTIFPTSNLQVGMFCWRTDLLKLYQLTALPAKWDLRLDGSVDYANMIVSKGTVSDWLDFNAARFCAAGMWNILLEDWSGSSHAPLAAGAGGMLMTAASGDNMLQTYVSKNDNSTFVRTNTGSAWTEWAKSWNSGNLKDLGQLKNGPGYISGITDEMVQDALGYKPVNANLLVSTSGNRWDNAIPVIDKGITEMGRFIDFHGSELETADHTVRLDGGGPGSTTLSLTGHLQTSGNITSTGNVTAFSDERLKTDVNVIENAIDKVSALRGVTFMRKDQADSGRQTGLIAQDVETVMPEAVRRMPDSGMLSVAYGNLVGLLVEAIKEQQKQIDDLKRSLSER